LPSIVSRVGKLPLDRRFGNGVVFSSTVLIMTGTGHHCAKRKSYASAFYAAAFLFFLVYSAPHRVHHFFEKIPAASHEHADGHHNNPDHQNKSPTESDCVFQATASRCVIGLTPLIQPLTTALPVHNFVDFPHTVIPQISLSSVFQIRAPPKA